ncbi:LacI family DNA-binding transcriptional regulator [Halalkalibacter krulwichiae]|uniref:LacI family DNA-binding transcriptional regulator n=1 Tax=Halalkalibacter krulwichiae TaxID=199441 RepID=UPI000825B856|nr:LacI family DNA-binding transcriptional regulator [Halalkalibacter krulwichiae]
MKRKKNSRVTLQDVANHAGVSRATASLIVRNSPNISEEKRNKVLKSIRELGYVYDRVAANLRSQQSTTVGLIITDIANPFYSELLIGVHNALEANGYTVFLGTTFDSDKKQEKLLSTMLEHRVGGVILCPVSESSKETIERISHLNVPIVLAVREIKELNCDYVGIDYREGAKVAVKHLITKGHKRIAFLGGTSESSAWKERKRGYAEALEEAGIKVEESLIVENTVTREGGVASVNKVLRYKERPTAAFCFNDLVARGVMQGLKDHDLTPGLDMALVGFDNVQEAAMYTPPLTTVNSFARRIGTESASLLHQRISNNEEDKKRIILQPELVVRESTKLELQRD